MVCPNCGKELLNDAVFCGGCGARQTAPVRQRRPSRKKKSNFKVGIVIGLAVLLLVVIFAFAAGSGKQTVYVLHYTAEYAEDGSIYDRNYNIDKTSGNLTMEAVIGSGTQYHYDAYGNLIKENYYNQFYNRDYNYENSYDKDGLLESCEVYYMDEFVTEWEFEWENDSIVRASQEISFDEPDTWNIWQEYEYDDEGRLETEYWCWAGVDSNDRIIQSYTLLRYEYDYDERGNLETLCYSYASWLNEEQAEKPEKQDYEKVYILELEYDKNDNLIYYELSSDTINEDGDVDYDKNGNRLSICDSEFTYDNKGNVISIEYDDGSSMKLDYEKVTMNKEAAQRYLRWMSLKGMDPVKKEIQALLVGSHSYYELFYYYLIPNPMW